MSEIKLLSKEELLEQYADDDWRARYVLLEDLTDLLGESIIKQSYVVPDEMNRAIHLTPYGTKVMSELLASHGVGRQNVGPNPLKPNDARMMCALTMRHVELLVDVAETSIGAMESAVNKQILAGEIRFPSFLGRELYDAAAELFPTERSSLSIEETRALLDATGPGIAQSGKYLAGPFGLWKVSQWRDVTAGRQVPLYHCADIDCPIVHRSTLATDRDAPVNRHREKLHKILEKESNQASDWVGFFAEISGMNHDSYDDSSPSTLPFLVGDSLNDEELLRLSIALVERDITVVADHLTAAGLGFRKNAFNRVLSRAELLQIALAFDDAVIGEVLDRLVEVHRVEIPAGEIRRAVVNSRYRVGAFHLRAELGPYGVRHVSQGSSIAPLKLRALLEDLYLKGQTEDEAELDWQLRGVDAPERESRLEEFFRTSTPIEVLTRLVLSRRTNMVIACDWLGIRVDPERDDQDFLNMMMWKIGFDLPESANTHAKFWRLHSSMERLAKDASVSSSVDQETIRSVATNFFVAIEELLDDAMYFTAWSLMSDHFAMGRKFSFDAQTSRNVTHLMLTEAISARPETGDRIELSEERNTLYPLCRSFALIAAELERRLGLAEEFARIHEDYPRFDGHTKIKQFPFVHTVAFLDLAPSSRIHILNRLKEISKLLVGSELHLVRNDYLHFRRSNAEIERMEKVLTATAKAVRILESEGFGRSIHRLVSARTDEWGRSSYVLKDSRGHEITLTRPSQFDWLGLPSLDEHQYVMPSAILAEPNEILRFSASVTSAYSEMWSDYPQRRARNKSGFEDEGSELVQEHSEMNTAIA